MFRSNSVSSEDIEQPKWGRFKKFIFKKKYFKMKCKDMTSDEMYTKYERHLKGIQVKQLILASDEEGEVFLRYAIPIIVGGLNSITPTVILTGKYTLVGTLIISSIMIWPLSILFIGAWMSSIYHGFIKSRWEKKILSEIYLEKVIEEKSQL